jgi:NAD(P)-dependent dehydrogenase (short-subunit alcohol dehydrogenase family)
MVWDVKDKTVLVTGASSGIGKATAAGLAACGARVVMASRTGKRGEKARRDVARRSGNDTVDLIVADLSTTGGVKGLAGAFRARHDRLHVLVNNAALVTSSRRVTTEGFELQFFVNYLAHFLLTHLLLDTLTACAPARIVNVTSTAHSSGTIDFDDLQCERTYKGYKMYANTKLMDMVFTYELSRRLQGTGVTANCVHPGIIHTNLLRNYSSVLHLAFHAFGAFFKQPDEGAETPVYLASSPDVDGVTGKYFKRCAPLGSSVESTDEDVQRRLWETSAALLGLDAGA